MCCTSDIEKHIRFAKPLLIVINCISFILGAALLGIGCRISTQSIEMVEADKNVKRIPQNADEMKEEKEEIDFYLAIVCSIIIFVGILMCLLSLFGCLGATKETKKLLIPYIIAVVLIALAQLTGLAMSVVYQRELKDSVSTILELRLQYYNADLSLTKSWDHAMSDWNCCGIKGWKDFKNLTDEKIQTVPKYCCLGNSTNCNVNNAQLADVPGCFAKIYNNIYYPYVFVILAIEAVIKICGVIACSFILRKSLGGSEKFWKWKSQKEGFKSDKKMRKSFHYIL